MTVADLVLVPILGAAIGVVLGGVALAKGWQSFGERSPRQRRQRGLAPRVGVIARDSEGVR